jgi:DNA-binding SARP family transcriptional activator
MRAVMTQAKTRASRMARAAGSGRLLLRATGRLIAPSGAAIDLEPKDALLLAYLAVEGPTPRVRLAELLWPDADEERARGNLRQRLLRLRRTTGIELVVGNPHAALAAGIGHDLDETCELLQGIASSQAGGLADWLEAQRERRRRARIAWLDAACTQAEVEGDLAAALAHAEALVALDPTSEHAHRRVMKLHYLLGDAAAALAAYQRCRQTLERELNAAPSAETEALRNSVGSALVAPASAPARRAVPLSVLRPPRLIGREAELAALQSAWDAAQPALVLGEAGLGKTRLVGDFAHAHGAVPVVAARPGDAQVVYALATRLLRQLPAEVTAALDAAVRKELARLLPEFGEAAPIGSEAERARFFNAVGAAVAAAAQRLDGLVIDDLHFADDASVELIRYVTASGPLRWLFAARPAEVGAQARELIEAMRRQSAGTVIELAPLTLPQLAEFIDSLGIDGLTGADSAPALLRQTGGNPLFVLETIRNWLAQHTAAGTAPALSAQRLPVASSMSSIVQRRIGRLSPDAIKLARCAAVAGQDFSAELAAHVLGVRPLDLADAWAELEAAQVFRDGAFAHDLIYEAALASVPPPIARELHGQIARFLVSRNAPASRLAEHWLAAGQQREALAALLRAASSARYQTMRVAEALRLYERAAEVAEGLGDHDACFEAIAAQIDTLMTMDRDQLADAPIERLLTHATTPRQMARARSLHAEILMHRGLLPQSIAEAQHAADLARAAGDEEAAVGALSTAAAAATQLNDAERAVRILRPLLPWTLEHASDDTRINVLGHLGVCLDNIDHQAEAQAMHQRAIEAAMRAQRHDQAVSALGNLAVSLLDVGRPRAALEAIARARSVAASYDVVKGAAFALNLFEGVAAAALRKYRTALAALDAARADVGHNALANAAASLHRACLWIHLGQYARAERELAQPTWAEPSSTWLEARRHQMLGRCAWWTGRKAEAHRHWEAAAARAPTGERAVLAAMIALDRALTQPFEDALHSARAVLDKAERLGHHGSVLAAQIRIATLACEHGDVSTALQAHAACRQVPEDVEPNDMYAGERWLAGVRALLAAGRREDAAEVVAEAVAAIERIARDDVPAEFRDSFLHRNPVNRELLTLATRLK